MVDTAGTITKAADIMKEAVPSHNQLQDFPSARSLLTV